MYLEYHWVILNKFTPSLQSPDIFELLHYYQGISATFLSYGPPLNMGFNQLTKQTIKIILRVEMREVVLVRNLP